MCACIQYDHVRVEFSNHFCLSGPFDVPTVGSITVVSSESFLPSYQELNSLLGPGACFSLACYSANSGPCAPVDLVSQFNYI